MSDRNTESPVAAVPGKRRHSWLAALLSLLLPGLGQLYAGHWRRAAVFLLAAALIDFPFVLGIWSYALVLLQPNGFWLAFAIGAVVVLFRFAAVVDAALVARRTPMRPLAPYQRWYVYVVLICLWNVPGFSGTATPGFGTESYSIPGGSMLPTVEIGDFVLGVRLPGDGVPPDRGTVVTHVDPGSGDTYIRRIVGLPGDTVEMRDGILILNGSPVGLEPAGTYRDAAGGEYAMLQESLPGGASYSVLDKMEDSSLDNMPALTVPPGYVFLLGDNRDNARDNRIGGPIPIASLEAEVLYVYWSADFDRIGRRLD